MKVFVCWEKLGGNYWSVSSPASTPLVWALTKYLRWIFSRPGRSQGLLYNHLRNSFTNSLILCENIFMAPPRPYGWRCWPVSPLPSRKISPQKNVFLGISYLTYRVIFRCASISSSDDRDSLTHWQTDWKLAVLYHLSSHHWDRDTIQSLKMECHSKWNVTQNGM